MLRKYGANIVILLQLANIYFEIKLKVSLKISEDDGILNDALLVFDLQF